MNKIVLSLLLLALPSAGFAKDGEADFYSDIFSDQTLTFTTALGFQQKKKKIWTADVEGMKRDLDGVHAALEKCKACGFRVRSRAPGIEWYEGSWVTSEGEKLRLVLRLLYPDEGVDAVSLVQNFNEAVMDDDVVFYGGHSRNGLRFPSFAAPTSYGGSNFYYNPDERGWRGFDAWKKRRDRQQLLVVNSCKTKNYFQEPLQQHAKKLGLPLWLILTLEDNHLRDTPAVFSALLTNILEKTPLDQLPAVLQETADHYNAFHFMDAVQKPLFELVRGFDFVNR
ncbi:hypothetical protein K2X30_09175 [bacterium]|nr:hypothetical protein [bacterium]